MDFCYVILHYQNIEVTKECVELLKNIKSDESTILIVDNGSPNGSGLVLEDLHKNENQVIVLLSEQNLGFAKGNNVGYLYAKNTLKAQTIVIMNSDVFINQMSFEEDIKKIYQQSNAHIIAPNIITPSGVHQNPYRIDRLSNKKIIRRIVLYSIVLILNRTFGWKSASKIFNTVNKKTTQNITETYKLEKNNIIPHGSCIIYTKKYIKNENIAFVPITFLFCEEDILYDYVTLKGYKITYTPKVNVNHMEDASINISINEDSKRIIFNLKNRLKSLIILLKYRYMITIKRRK